jgi:hypothetical protein
MRAVFFWFPIKYHYHDMDVFSKAYPAVYAKWFENICLFLYPAYFSTLNLVFNQISFIKGFFFFFIKTFILIPLFKMTNIIFSILFYISKNWNVLILFFLLRLIKVRLIIFSICIRWFFYYKAYIYFFISVIFVFYYKLIFFLLIFFWIFYLLCWIFYLDGHSYVRWIFVHFFNTLFIMLGTIICWIFILFRMFGLFIFFCSLRLFLLAPLLLVLVLFFWFFNSNIFLFFDIINILFFYYFDFLLYDIIKDIFIDDFSIIILIGKFYFGICLFM